MEEWLHNHHHQLYLDHGRATILARSLPRNAAVLDNFPPSVLLRRGHFFGFRLLFFLLPVVSSLLLVCGVNVCASAGTTFYSPLLFASLTYHHATFFFSNNPSSQKPWLLLSAWTKRYVEKVSISLV